MVILINSTNLTGGGGVQVADSLCRSLFNFPQHTFIVVYSTALQKTARDIANYKNIVLIQYNYPPGDLKSYFTGRNKFLDDLVNKYVVQCVLTVFGPMKWKPRCPHLCGFALAHIVMPESPYFQRMTFRQRIKWFITIKNWEYIFKKSANNFYTENPLVSQKLQNKFYKATIYTFTNYYNQIFDQPENQVFHKISDFNGWQFLNVGSSAPHKNLSIAVEIARIIKTKFWDKILESKKPGFRFLFTINESDFVSIPDDLKEHFYFIGKVNISELPSLYEQTDFLFQPTLLECFTAVYPEAMRMKKPIITTDLEFARALCGKAAKYYSPTSAESASEIIIHLISSMEAREQLVLFASHELNKFDNYNVRIKKIINCCEAIVNNSK